MSSNRKNELKRAAKDLKKILEEIEPYVHKPTVFEPSTRGKWAISDDFWLTEPSNEAGESPPRN